MADQKRKAKERVGGRKESAKSAAAKPAAANAGAQKSSIPKVSRPQIPAVYGLPKHNKGLLPWSHVSERMAQAQVYWITTVDPGGRPHATPVDGLWLDGRLYFGGSQETRRNRNLARNPAVCVHLESGSDVVILYGEVEELGGENHELAQRLAAAANEKYGYGGKAEAYLAGGTFALTPRKVIAWKTVFKDATRWEF
jgi:nitroimidazol reductase NimA-like FMN-containing flavoprotein (pyridoxamine 5'-phosphate oxidase superfamily)